MEEEGEGESTWLISLKLWAPPSPPSKILLAIKMRSGCVSGLVGTGSTPRGWQQVVCQLKFKHFKIDWTSVSKYVPALCVKKCCKTCKAESIWLNLPICHVSRNPYISANVCWAGSLYWASAVGPTPISTILNIGPAQCLLYGDPGL